MHIKKGFTLIELLAVIVILAIIALISVPLILGVIDKVQMSAYKESVRSVFQATDLYIASNEFINFPDEGISVNDSRLQIKNKNFTSGKIIKNAQGQLELDKVSNGSFCAGGTINNIVVINGSCESLDMSAPNLNIASGVVTSNSISVVATAEDLESGIRSYQYSIDNGNTWTTEQIVSSYVFNNLVTNTSYTIKVRVYNNNNLQTTSNGLVITTNEITAPTYTANPTGWSQSKVVTINFPAREAGYVYEYSLDAGSTWEEVPSPATTKDLNFTENGTVIARINDGVNIVSGAAYSVTDIDNTAPVITVNPDVVAVVLGGTYTDTGVTATDVEMGDLTSNIVKSGSVDVNTIGTYTLTYNVSDAAGNVATQKTRTVNVIQGAFTFSYTGNSQSWTVPATGTYKLEVWGAQGGKNNNQSPIGAKGGYASGNLYVTGGTTLNIFVGGMGSNTGSSSGAVGGYNGGGYGGSSASSYNYGGGGGGGATDIRLGGIALSNRVIVAGGGGGSQWGTGGAGGGTSGISGATTASGSGHIGGAGTQSSGGNYGCYNGDYCGTSGSLGTGGRGGGGGIDQAGGGGGGGYYGGGGGGPLGGAGGGSAYIGGVTSGQTIAGNTTIPAPGGGTETGHSGNGYAKITFISQ